MSDIVITKRKCDIVPEVSDALARCKDGDVLRFEQGEYHFHPQEAFEKYYYISNNRHGAKRVAFPIIGKKNITIDGGGSRFVFHGEIIPFVVENSSNVVLKNFSIDWQRPFYSQGMVIEADESGVLLEIDQALYPYRVASDEIIFEGEGWEKGLTRGVFEFDVETRAPAYDSGDSMGLGFPDRIRVEKVEDGLIRLAESFPHLPRVGNVVVMRHCHRYSPGIHLRRSRDLLLDRVTLHHAGGMGVIAQFCDNITVRNCRVTPSGDRLFSVTVDATHFVNCRGLINLENCLFENQLDDPLNVHGINTRIHKVLDSRSLVVERVHHEQRGVEIAFAGDRMQLCKNTTLLAYAENEVAAVETIDARFLKVVFVDPLPDSLQPGHVLENISWTPDLHVSGCVSRNNRARGYLVSTPGKVLIENNRIESSGAGIRISGDANFWFESGAVRDVLIRNNDFGDCCYGPPEWGRAVIDIDPEISSPWMIPEGYHRNIRIENNRFFTSDVGILFARSVTGIRFAGNTVRRTENYPMSARMEALLTFEACEDVVVEENNIDGIVDDLICETAEVMG